MYLSTSNSNTFHHFAEMIAQRAMLGEIKFDPATSEADAERFRIALENVFDTVTEVARKLVRVFEAYSIILFAKYFPDAHGRQVLQILNAPDLDKIGIPFFAEREGRT
jgi:hypothetical protein